MVTVFFVKFVRKSKKRAQDEEQSWARHERSG